TKGSVDIAEVGTPLIIEEGMRPVREFKKHFPDIEVLSDAKIMDAGELEAETAIKAGADIVTVLGDSNDETILGAVKEAKKYHVNIMIDMIAVTNLEELTKEIDAMGV
ncbi:orotidine 5'-phosphate decarboxylase, partial [Longicatena caecimuris]|uniref:orotidine 5'-phosphate decarboxylase / HUMPS family protein n=1 Tax=Longicatena caecimuris TaxID=1796635 RepID=UPI002108CC34